MADKKPQAGKAGPQKAAKSGAAPAGKSKEKLSSPRSTAVNEERRAAAGETDVKTYREEQAEKKRAAVAEKPDRYFRLLPKAGDHHHEDGTVYKAGDTVTAKDNLVDLFPEKFVEVQEAPEEVEAESEDGEEAETLHEDLERARARVDVPDPNEGADEVDLSDAQDLTDKFDGAADAKLQVYKTKDGYYVVGEDAPNRPLHAEPLAKDDVTPFLESQKGRQ